MIAEELIIYGGVIVLSVIVTLFYVRHINRDSLKTGKKVREAKETGRFEPVSLHPYIDLTTCIGSGACYLACPEKDIIGIVNGQATVINASSCVGHGACFHACPVEAISLRIGTEKRGVELPHVNQNFETNVPGIFIAGELGGMGLIKNSVEQGRQAVKHIAEQLKGTKNAMLDLVIIGAGPAGISASLAARENGMRFVTLEQDSLGGTVFTFPRAKVVMTNPMDLPLYGKVKLHDTSKQELLDLWVDALNKNDIVIHENTKVESILPRDDSTFTVNTANENVFLARHILIAIGRRGSPRKLGIPGEGLPKVAYRLIESEKIMNQHILIVGGGDSAVEAAMLLMNHNEVTLSYRKETLSRIKAKNQERLDEAMAENKLGVIFNSQLTEIKEDVVELHLKGAVEETLSLTNDLVYIFIGGELPTRFLSNAGVRITKRFGYVMKKHA